MITKLIQETFRRFGYDLQLKQFSDNPHILLLQGLDYFSVDLVIDIGANIGQFASELRTAGYKKRIVSIEPLSGAHHLLSQAARNDPLWQVYERCALGDYDGEATINVSRNSVSSSLLPMLNAHISASNNAIYIDSETVHIRQLDSVIGSVIENSDSIFVKIDAQGFEWQVLKGATETLRQARGVLCELSFVPLYKGQHLWKEVVERLETEGFTLWTIQRGFSDRENGRTLQIDAVFFREEA